MFQTASNGFKCFSTSQDDGSHVAFAAPGWSQAKTKRKQSTPEALLRAAFGEANAIRQSAREVDGASAAHVIKARHFVSKCVLDAQVSHTQSGRYRLVEKGMLYNILIMMFDETELDVCLGQVGAASWSIFASQSIHAAGQDLRPGFVGSDAKFSAVLITCDRHRANIWLLKHLHAVVPRNVFVFPSLCAQHSNGNVIEGSKASRYIAWFFLCGQEHWPRKIFDWFEERSRKNPGSKSSCSGRQKHFCIWCSNVKMKGQVLSGLGPGLLMASFAFFRAHTQDRFGFGVGLGVLWSLAHKESRVMSQESRGMVFSWACCGHKPQTKLSHPNILNSTAQ